VFAGSVQELAAARQRVAEFLAEPGGRGTVQDVGLATQFQYDVTPLDRDGGLTGGEFLDQPPRGDFLYPRRPSSAR
jgi:hypothetical protein